MLQTIEQSPPTTRERVDHAVAITQAAVAELEHLLLAAIAARAVGMADEACAEIDKARTALAGAAQPGWRGRQAVDDIRRCLGEAKACATEARQAAKTYDKLIDQLGREE